VVVGFEAALYVLMALNEAKALSPHLSMNSLLLSTFQRSFRRVPSHGIVRTIAHRSRKDLVPAELLPYGGWIFQEATVSIQYECVGPEKCFLLGPIGMKTMDPTENAQHLG